MNKQQQKHELFITFAAHMEGSKRNRKPAPIKKRRKVTAKVSLSLRYQQVVTGIKERVQLQFQQIGQLFFLWKVRH